jgi:hypothetical protein
MMAPVLKLPGQRWLRALFGCFRQLDMPERRRIRIRSLGKFAITFAALP